MAKQAPPTEPPEAPIPEAQTPDTQTPDIPTPPPASRPTGNRFFTWIRSLGLVRQPGWIGGVSAGIAARIGIDVIVVRGILVVVAVLGGPAVLLYAIAWLVLPDSSDRIHLEDLLRGRVDSAIAAIAVLVALSLLPVAQGFWWFGSLYWGAPQWGNSAGRAIWTVVILGLLIWFAVWAARRGQHGSNGSTTVPTAPMDAGSATAASRTSATPTATTQTATAPATAPAAPPAAPAPGASTDEITAWRESQAEWKTEHAAFRQHQSTEWLAANQAATMAARAERVARALEYREQRARTRSNPLYSVALVGVALIAGAITTLVISGGAPDPIQFLVGAAVAVGILGVGIIVNGVLGRRSGGATAVAILLLVPLALAGIFPQSNTLRYSGNWTIVAHGRVGSTSHYELGSGNVTLDALDYFSTPRPTSGESKGGAAINLYVGSGTVTILVPNDEYVDVSRSIVTGSNSGGSFHEYYVGSDRFDNNEVRSISISAVVGSGHIIVVREPSPTGSASS